MAIKIENKRFQVTLPANLIHQHGINLIQLLVRDTYRLSLPDDWDWSWNTGGKGVYVGTLPKRISKWLYTQHKIKTDPNFLTQLGNYAAANSDKKAQTYYGDFTTKLDWDDGDFADHGSCFWSCRSAARDMIQDNGGGAVRFFSDSRYTNGIARAWIAPCTIKKEDDALVIFNAYGFDLLKIARIVASQQGQAYYRSVDLYNNNDADGTLWINSAAGLVIGPIDLIGSLTEVDLEWPEYPMGPECVNCHERIPDGDEYYFNELPYCETCFRECVFCCPRCNTDTAIEDAKMVGKERWCRRCFRTFAIKCHMCDTYVNKHYHATYADHAGHYYCDKCGKGIKPCDTCQCLFHKTDLQKAPGRKLVCAKCAKYLAKTTVKPKTRKKVSA